MHVNIEDDVHVGNSVEGYVRTWSYRECHWGGAASSKETHGDTDRDTTEDSTVSLTEREEPDHRADLQGLGKAARDEDQLWRDAGFYWGSEDMPRPSPKYVSTYRNPAAQKRPRYNGWLQIATTPQLLSKLRENAVPWSETRPTNCGAENLQQDWNGRTRALIKETTSTGYVLMVREKSFHGQYAWKQRQCYRKREEWVMLAQNCQEDGVCVRCVTLPSYTDLVKHCKWAHTVTAIYFVIIPIQDEEQSAQTERHWLGQYAADCFHSRIGRPAQYAQEYSEEIGWTTQNVSILYREAKLAEAIRYSQNRIMLCVGEKTLTELRELAPDDQCAALARTVPAAVTAEKRLHYWGYALSVWDLARDIPELPHPSELMDWNYYIKAPSGMAAIFKVHPVHILQALYQQGKHIPPFLRVVIAIHADMVDFEVAAIIMWWVTMPQEIRRHMVEAGMHRIHHLQDAAALAERYEVVRQQGVACSCHLGRELFQWLRKAGNLKGRVLGKADLVQEKQRMLVAYSYRTFTGGRSAHPRVDYMMRFIKAATPVVFDVVRNVIEGKSWIGLDAWWERRRMNVASGSSSNRKILDQVAAHDDRILSGDRPNKKAIVEALPHNYLRQLLGTIPYAVGRQSTKPEPGRKLRALYAGDDECTYVAAYASHAMEVNMNTHGMCPQQRPKDSVRWMKDCMERNGPAVWFSLDFSDFNKDHSSEDLMLLNLVIAQAWLALDDTRTAVEKSRASLWTAYSVYNRFVHFEGAETGVRTLSGLWSGHRDTARDNTMLHKIYQNMVVQWLDECHPGWGSILRTHLCGDDEDSLLSDDVAAALYYRAFSSLGWHMNSTKQCCGKDTHEFLQRMPDDECIMRAPITSMICSLCSGQWYKEPGQHQDAAIAACSDQYWEMIVRGGDPSTVYKIGCRLLDAYMQVRIDGEQKRKLEWWKFRCSMPPPKQHFNVPHPQEYTKDLHPMWDHGGEMDVPRAPAAFWINQKIGRLPRRASAEWGKHLLPLFLKYSTQDVYNRYVNNMAAESYGTLFFHHIEGQRREYLKTDWPERSTPYAEMDATLLQWETHVRCRKRAARRLVVSVKSMLYWRNIKKMPPTKGEVLARSGIDLVAYELLGGDSNDELVEKFDVRHCLLGARTPLAHITDELRMATPFYDPAIRCVLYTTGCL